MTRRQAAGISSTMTNGLFLEGVAGKPKVDYCRKGITLKNASLLRASELFMPA